MDFSYGLSKLSRKTICTDGRFHLFVLIRWTPTALFGIWNCIILTDVLCLPNLQSGQAAYLSLKDVCLVSQHKDTNDTRKWKCRVNKTQLTITFYKEIIPTVRLFLKWTVRTLFSVSLSAQIIRIFVLRVSERRIKEIWEGGRASHNPSTNALYTNKHCFS